jgi:hypothetical protein
MLAHERFQPRGVVQDGYYIFDSVLKFRPAVADDLGRGVWREVIDATYRLQVNRDGDWCQDERAACREVSEVE